MKMLLLKKAQLSASQSLDSTTTKNIILILRNLIRNASPKRIRVLDHTLRICLLGKDLGCALVLCEVVLVVKNLLTFIFIIRDAIWIDAVKSGTCVFASKSQLYGQQEDNGAA
jgi:hypothetical protein